MRIVTVALVCALTSTISAAPGGIERSAEKNGTPLALAAARVSLEGSSNIHAFTASTTDVRVTAVEIGGTPTGELFDSVLQPGGLKTFDVEIAAASLSSPKDGIDKNMHKALKVREHPAIRFSLRTFESTGDAYRAVGSLTIAGVEKEVTLTLQIQRKGAALAVTGATDLLMTDFGITPPKAMLGMLRTNPKVQIRIELTLDPSLT
jgi:polyisoprenoid-binding protein YceI